MLEDYSIFYFKIQVVSLDMTVRLWYLGEVGSLKEVKKLLLTHDKVEGELKSSINAVRKGLYRFEFDNSTSWINSKRIRYENEVFAPLQIKTSTADDWVEDFYGNLFMNDVGEEEEVVAIDNSKPPEKHPEKAEKTSGEGQRQAEGERVGDPVNAVVNIERRGKHCKVTVRGRASEYIYETDNLERMMQKINKLAASKDKYRWQLEGRVSILSRRPLWT